MVLVALVVHAKSRTQIRLLFAKFFISCFAAQCFGFECKDSTKFLKSHHRSFLDEKMITLDGFKKIIQEEISNESLHKLFLAHIELRLALGYKIRGLDEAAELEVSKIETQLPIDLKSQVIELVLTTLPNSRAVQTAYVQIVYQVPPLEMVLYLHADVAFASNHTIIGKGGGNAPVFPMEPEYFETAYAVLQYGNLKSSSSVLELGYMPPANLAILRYALSGHIVGVDEKSVPISLFISGTSINESLSAFSNISVFGMDLFKGDLIEDRSLLKVLQTYGGVDIIFAHNIFQKIKRTSAEAYFEFIVPNLLNEGGTLLFIKDPESSYISDPDLNSLNEVGVATVRKGEKRAFDPRIEDRMNTFMNCTVYRKGCFDTTTLEKEMVFPF